MVLVVLFVFILLELVISGNSKKTCADSQCKEPISKARAQVVYLGRQENFLSFPKDAEIVIYEKNAGKHNNLWLGEFKGKRGFLPPALVREFKIINRNVLEISHEDEDEEEAASNTTETSGQEEEENETSPIIHEDVNRIEVDLTSDKKPENAEAAQNESSHSKLSETGYENAAPPPSDASSRSDFQRPETELEDAPLEKSSDLVSSSSEAEHSQVPDASTLGELIHQTWSSIKGTATILSQPLETLQSALSKHADEFSSTLFKGVMVGAEEFEHVKTEERQYVVSEGTTLAEDFEYSASEEAYGKKSEDDRVAPSVVSLPSNTVGHASTPSMPDAVSGVGETVNVRPTEAGADVATRKNDVKPSSPLTEIEPTQVQSTAESSRDYVPAANDEIMQDEDEKASAVEATPSEDSAQGTPGQNEEDEKSAGSWLSGLWGEETQKAEAVENSEVAASVAETEEDSFIDSELATEEEEDEEGGEDDDDDEDATIDEDEDMESEMSEVTADKDGPSENVEAKTEHRERAKTADKPHVEDEVNADDALKPTDEPLVETRSEKDADEQRTEAKAVEAAAETEQKVRYFESLVTNEGNEGVPRKSFTEQIMSGGKVTIKDDPREPPANVEEAALAVRERLSADQGTSDAKAVSADEIIIETKTETKVDEVPNSFTTKLAKAKKFYKETLKSEVGDEPNLRDAAGESGNVAQAPDATNTMASSPPSGASDGAEAKPEQLEKAIATNTLAGKPSADSFAANDSGSEEILDEASAVVENFAVPELEDIMPSNHNSMHARANGERSSAAGAIRESVAVKGSEVYETSVNPFGEETRSSSSGFLPGVGSQSVVEMPPPDSKIQHNPSHNEDVVPTVEPREAPDELATGASPRSEEETIDETRDRDDAFVPAQQITKSVAEVVDALRSYVQLFINVLPEFVRLYLEELEEQGVSPRVMVFTIMTGIFNLMFLVAYLIIKRRSKEGRLIERLCKLDKQLFEAATEKEVVKEELKSSKLKLSNLAGSSVDAQQSIDALSDQLLESKTSRGKLQEQVARLELQLETATEAGFELSTMLTNFLTSQNETRKLGEVVTFLKEQREQQTTLVGSMRENAEQTLQQHQQLEDNHNEVTKEATSLKEENSRLTSSLEESEVARNEVAEALNFLQNQIAGIEKINSQLLEEAQVWNQRVQELQQQSELFQKSTEELQETLTLKEGELNVLQDCMLKLKIVQDETSDDTTETPLEKLEKLMDVSRVTAELKTVSMEKNSLIERLNVEEGRSKQAEDLLKKIQTELEQVLHTKANLQEERDAACTKLQVLSNYFKEKEIELQRELGVQEAKRQVTQETAMTVTQQIAMYEKDIAMYKSQIETLKKELESQARSFKNQISQLESKAHDNWLATRAADRRSEEAKQEAGMLRNKLNLVEQDKKLDRSLGEGIVKPTPKRYAGSNGEIPSPPQLDSGPVDFHPPSGPSSLLREPLEPPLPQLSFLPQDRPLPPPPLLGFPHHLPPPPPYLRDRMPFDVRIPPFPYDMPRRMMRPPPHMMPMPPLAPLNRDRYSPPPPSNRITPPYDPNSPPPRDYRSPPPMMDRWNAPASPPFDRRPPSGRRTSPPTSRPPFDTRFMPLVGRSSARAERIPPQQEAHHHATPNSRDPFDKPKTPASESQISPRSASSADQDETTTAV